MAETKDRNGTPVNVGTLVRVVSIPPSMFKDLPEEEIPRVRSFIGDVLSVYEVDAQGSAWVEKWWSEGKDQSASHSVALSPAEMEVVSNESVA